MLLLDPKGNALAEDPIKEIIRTFDSQRVDEDELISLLGEKVIVFMGEVHSDQRHHQIHTRIIERLISRYGSVNLAMEALPQRSQGVIDEFVEGKIKEADYLRQVKWDQVWGFDYGMYKPKVDLVISSGGRVWGIGADLETIRRIARLGLEGMEENLIPQRGLFLGPKGYRERVLATYEPLKVHRDIGPFDHFFLAQVMRDELMALNLKNAFLADPKRTIVISGNQHIVNYWGIPSRFLRRLSLPVATLVVYSGTQGLKLKPHLNEFLLITP